MHEHQALYDLIAANPGIRAYKLGKLANMGWGKIIRRLMALDTVRLLIYEDPHGGLYPFLPDLSSSSSSRAVDN